MKTIRFIDNGSECIIPSGNDLKPLKFFMANKKYGAMIEHDGGGYAVSPAIEGRFVNYFDFKNSGQTGRFVYVRDQASKRSWNICRQNDSDNREVHFGLGLAAIEDVKDEIIARFSVTVPDDDIAAEIWEISFTNLSSAKRKLAFFTYLEFFLGGGMALWDEPEWYTRACFCPEENLFEVKVYLPEKECDNEVAAFMAPSFQVDDWCASRADFLGAGDEQNPEAVLMDKLPSKPAYGERTAGVLRHEFEIDAGEKMSFELIVGRADSKIERDKILGKLKNSGGFKGTAAKVRKSWEKKFDHNYIKTPDSDLDRWVNIWLKYQQAQSVLWGGGVSANSPLMGFRDILQHAAGYALIDPFDSKELILEALQYQSSDGRAVRQWSRRGRHDTRDYRDSPLWIIHTLDAYIKETGDLDILEHKVPFLDKGCGSVIDHYQKALTSLWNDLGAHGLSHIGEGDWLDPLNRCGSRGKGESIWLTMALIVSTLQAAELYEYISENEKAEHCRQRISGLREAVEKHGWDGKWYLRAYDDRGYPVGSSEEGRIFLNPQTWAVLSGCADSQRSDELFRTVDGKLKTPYGYMLYFPRYEQYSEYLGNISILQMKDIVYTHANSFKIFADCLRNDGNAALESFKAICPENPANHYTTSGAEPYIIPNGYHGPAHSHPGQVLYSGFSGAFSWLLRGVLEQIMGARATYDGLRLAPCLPTGWRESFISRSHRGVEYRIHYRKVDESRTPGIKCDGNTLNGNVLPAALPGSICEVVFEYH